MNSDPLQGMPENPRAAVANLSVDTTTRFVCDALANGGVRCILLKGPSFARWLYPQPFLRTYTDTDVLVAERSFARAAEILTGLGFEGSVLDIPGNRPSHARTFRRPQDEAVVDLHVTITGAEALPGRVWDVLSERTQTMELLGAEVKILDEPARVVHVVLHAAHHGEKAPNAFEDLRRAIETSSEQVWREAAALASELDASSAFTIGLASTEDGRGMAARLGVEQTMSTEAALVRDVRISEDALSGALAVEWLRRLPGLRAKVAFVRRKLVPPRAWLVKRYGSAGKGGPYLAVAYLRRIGFVIVSAIRGAFAWLRARANTNH